MDNAAMLEKAKQIVVDYFNMHADATDHKQITKDDVFIVWFCKTLQNWKALVSTTIPDCMYYESPTTATRARRTSTPTKSWRTSVYRTDREEKNIHFVRFAP